MEVTLVYEIDELKYIRVSLRVVARSAGLRENPLKLCDINMY